MKKMFSISLLILCGCFFFMCAVGSSSSDGELGGSSTKEDEFEVLETKGYADKSKIFYYVEGKAKNKTNKKYSYVQVKFNVYDKEGTVIGSCLDNQNDIMGGETWKFKAICSGETKYIKNYKYTGYDAW